jgi:hypothetical protein
MGAVAASTIGKDGGNNILAVFYICGSKKQKTAHRQSTQGTATRRLRTESMDAK